jgi:hypothetical protein
MQSSIETFESSRKRQNEYVETANRCRRLFLTLGTCATEGFEQQIAQAAAADASANSLREIDGIYFPRFFSGRCQQAELEYIEASDPSNRVREAKLRSARSFRSSIVI